MMHPTTHRSTKKAKSKPRGLYSLLPGVGHKGRTDEEDDTIPDEEDEGDIGTAMLQILDPLDYKVTDGQGDADEMILPYEYEVAREKALVRRLDRRLMPCLFAMIVLK
jgi:hypothetical protein